MNRFIFGFQRRVWCPKWTPASNSCFMVTTGAIARLSDGWVGPAWRAPWSDRVCHGRWTSAGRPVVARGSRQLYGLAHPFRNPGHGVREVHGVDETDVGGQAGAAHRPEPGQG